ncbi:hormogonium polysaccharide biosynthesis protein HpsL [Phormidium pseudopriestleyi FRX01]|uniref:Hormogonium polysaccharide biosynthesis protein HpsL n=1 Tax=Phormidium pseudopriestleyi FRX01 TaxID=1759528 RepID=A0ABS3FP60_9CYAN|nr:hormogonium polysaccharide biosynthesis protein HpsL [Phormidium pseudopriestleyi]MBO0348904.1 hormogonium polysaccharide biosynthesis protein HpsL [Phormidium pseudopriestleyi FRX01]
MLKNKQKSQKKSQTNQEAQAPSVSKKELAAQQKKVDRERKAMIQSFQTYGGLGAAIGIVLFFVADFKLAIAGGGGVAVLFLSYKYPRLAIWGFLIYMPFSGTITYWIGGGNAIFQLAKDGFYVPGAIALYQEIKRKKLPFLIPPQLGPALNILLLVCLMTLVFVNGAQQFGPKPEGQPIPMGILGLKVFLGYIPLLGCSYYLIRNKKEFLWLTRTHVVLALICCGLGVLQYWLLLTGRCAGTRGYVGEALFKATLDAKCLVGGSLVFSPEQSMIRLPGTFVAPWQWAWFLIANLFFTFASAFNDPSLVWKILSFLGMALVFVNSVISGQRIALALVPVFAVILLVVTGQVTNLKRFIPIAIGISILGFGAMALFPDVVTERIDSFISRWNASPPTDFIADQAEFTSKGQDGFFGNGLGRATNSARMFGDPKLIETYYPKLLYEIGPVGVIGFLIFVTTLTYLAFKAYRSVKDKNLRGYGASYWVFILFISYNTYYYPLDVDPVAVYYWVFAGLLFKLPDLDREVAQEKLEAEELGLLGEKGSSKKKQKKK